MNKILFKSVRKIYRHLHPGPYNWLNQSHVQYRDQEANDVIRNRIETAKAGLMISKFGTIELETVCCFKRIERGLKKSDYLDAIKGKSCVLPEEALTALCINSGFFPNDQNLGKKYTDLVLQDVREIDILSSYIDQEDYLQGELKHCIKVNLNGYYAPFLWNNPWTKELKGKRVLVVHPFIESIRSQYEKRKFLFENPDVLPDFKELILIKAVQSIAGNGINTGFASWFEALEFMKREIDSHDYDVALIGCGAYGMDLAAHVKRKGKIAIHLAGWTQMLFGIYGNRWLTDQPQYAKFINKYWVRPLASEKPKGADKVENECYW